MNSAHFFLIAVAIVVLVYMAVRNRGDVVGWWIGLGHAVLAMLASAGWASASDTGFAVAMFLLAVYAGAMSASEIVTRLRASGTAR